METSNKIIILLLVCALGCGTKDSLKNVLKQGYGHYWDVYDTKNKYPFGSYTFGPDGKSLYYYIKGKKRTLSFDGDVVYPHTWLAKGDTTMIIHGFSRVVLQFNNDKIALKNPRTGDTMLLMKSDNLEQ
jgi:hypothetical protein